MVVKNSLLTKTRFMSGLQCPKLLWFAYNQKEKIPPIDSVTHAIFAQGIQIGTIAHQLFANGFKLTRNPTPSLHMEQSVEALKTIKPLFEPGFIFGNTYALADILNPVDEDVWDLIEVKSSTQVKDEYYEDVAFQKYVYEGAGIKINRCYLWHIDNQYVRHGDLNPSELFAKVDISEQVLELQSTLTNKIENMLAVISNSEIPDIKIGEQCDAPYECGLKYICWDFLPQKDSVFSLTRGKKLAFSLLDSNVVDIKNIPENIDLTERQNIQIKAHKTNVPYVDKQFLADFINSVTYPLYFVDFETFSPAIPQFDLSRPYERIPFQYSLFIMPEEGTEPEHYSFLWKDKSDPRIAFIKQLKGELGEHGSVIAYNSNFEIGVLESVCGTFPQYRDWLNSVIPRFIDLYVPFRDYYYYHPNQQGSASIKSVLPVLTGKGYSDLNISNGEMASKEYFRVTFSDAVFAEQQALYADLEEYCRLDTYGMIEIYNALKSKIKRQEC